MAYIPSADTTVLSASSTDILNAIRNELGGGYAKAVPIADGSLANLQTIGTIIVGSAEIRNKFIDMINAIGLTIVKSAVYYNEWRDLKLGTMELGEIAREAFVHVVMPKLYNPNAGADEFFSWTPAKVSSAIHYINYKTFYKIPISRNDIRKAFSYASGVSDMVDRIIQQAEIAEQYDEYLAMRYVVARCIVEGRAKIIHTDAISAATAEQIAEDIKAISDELDFMSTDYNEAGVPRTFPKSEQLVIMTPRANAINNVRVLANAFNESRVEWTGVKKKFDRLVPTDYEYRRLEQLFSDPGYFREFTSEEEDFLNTVQVMMMSKDKMFVLDTLVDSENFRNGETLMDYFWFHHHKIMSDSPFGMLIAFSSDDLTVTAIAITPATVTVSAGTSAQFTAEVTASVGASKDVVWSVSGNNSSATWINENGLLYVSPDETAATITVTATSVFDDSVSQTATVTVS